MKTLLMTLLMTLLIMTGLGGLNTHLIHAQEQGARLAVLELQGSRGTLEQRQAWTDTIRMIALELLTPYNIYVIDRDQFVELLSPKRTLSDCVGLCAAELAREVGAQWSLSGSIMKSSSQTQLITLRLHHASGQLIGLKQVDYPLSQNLQDPLRKMSMSLFQETLLKGFAHSSKAEEDRAEMTPAPDSSLTLIPWVEIIAQDRTHCVSPQVTLSQYQESVKAGACSASKTWGRCAHPRNISVRCVNLQQALCFSDWAGGRLLSKREWDLWRVEVSKLIPPQTTLELPFEWVVPTLDHQSAESQWRGRLMILSDRELKQAPPLTAYRLLSPSRAFDTRRVPPAFAVSDLSFRVIYPEDRCPSMRIK